MKTACNLENLVFGYSLFSDLYYLLSGYNLKQRIEKLYSFRGFQSYLEGSGNLKQFLERFWRVAPMLCFDCDRSCAKCHSQMKT